VNIIIRSSTATPYNVAYRTGFISEVNFAVQISCLLSDIAEQVDGNAVGVAEQNLIITVQHSDKHRTNSRIDVVQICTRRTEII